MWTFFNNTTNFLTPTFESAIDEHETIKNRRDAKGFVWIMYDCSEK